MERINKAYEVIGRLKLELEVQVDDWHKLRDENVRLNMENAKLNQLTFSYKDRIAKLEERNNKLHNKIDRLEEE
jgi:hypothetical protein